MIDFWSTVGKRSTSRHARVAEEEGDNSWAMGVFYSLLSICCSS